MSTDRLGTGTVAAARTDGGGAGDGAAAGETDGGVDRRWLGAALLGLVAGIGAVVVAAVLRRAARRRADADFVDIEVEPAR
jgi:hypothetical protein